MDSVMKSLPMVALRGLTIMPEMVVHFDVSRERSITAVQQAMMEDQKIFLVAQKSIETEDPGQEDVYSIGTVATVRQVIKLPKKIVRVLVSGEQRGRLTGISEKEPYLKAEVERLEETDFGIEDEIQKEARYEMLRKHYPKLYNKYAARPVNEKKVVFIEVRESKISDSFSLMYKKVQEEHKYEIHTHFLRSGFSKRKDYQHACEAMITDIADAKYIFLNESSDVIAALPMRKETIVTQLWHGCGAFKKFGMSTAELIFGDDRKTLEKYPYHGNYTYVTVSSPEVVWAYEEAMSLQDKKGVVVPTGISRSDIFYDEEAKKAAQEKLLSVVPQAKGKKVILYAPTFRGRVAKAKTPNKLDIAAFGDALGKDYILLFKLHPFVKKRTAIPEGYEDFAFDLTDDMSIEELLFVADICISDYSSLVFEYSLFEKPMIFFAFDLDNYYDWRGFYYDYKDFVPGPIHTTTEEMIEYIQHVDERFDKKKVQEFRQKFMSACDGHATERIMKMMFGE